MKNNDSIALVPYSSRWGVGSLGNEFDNLFDSLFDRFWQEPSFLMSRNWRASQVTEDKDNYYVDIELPGFKKSEINISAINNTLKISAKNNKSVYSRAFSLSGWDTSKIKTKLENGVLTAIVAKTPEAKERIIDIEEIDDSKSLPPVSSGGGKVEKKEEEKKK